MTQVVVLGSGTSSGVPMLGRHYSKEFLANPKNHRTRPSILIQGPEGNFLVDATPEMRVQLLREEVYDLSAALITHTHADHIMGMDDLRCFSGKYKRPFPIYALPEAQADIRRVFDYAFKPFPPGVEVPRFELLPVEDVMHVAGLEILTMSVLHGALPVIALRIKDFAYVTDVSEIPPDAWKKLQNLDTLVLDAVRVRPHPNHFHLDKAVEMACKLGARLTYFTHLSHDFDHDLTEQSLPPHIRLAYDGLRFALD